MILLSDSKIFFICMLFENQVRKRHGTKRMTLFYDIKRAKLSQQKRNKKTISFPRLQNFHTLLIHCTQRQFPKILLPRWHQSLQQLNWVHIEMSIMSTTKFSIIKAATSPEHAVSKLLFPAKIQEI